MLQTGDLLPVDSTRPLKLHWLIFRVMGVHAPKGRESLWGRHYRTYSIFWNVTFHLCMSLSMVVNFLMSNSLESFCDSLSVAMPYTIYMLKLVNVWAARDRLLQTHHILRYLDTRLCSATERRIVRTKGIRRSHRVLWNIFIGVAAVFICGIAYIILSSERTLMYPSWIPWQWKESRTAVFVSTVAAHTGCLAETAVLVYNVATYPCTYLILLSAHTRALACRFARLGHSARETQQQTHLRLLDYIWDHQMLIQILKSLERSLSKTCFMQFFCMACSQCTICYLILFEKIGFMPLVNMLCLLLAFTCETLLLCYSAELVHQAGNDLLSAVYSCNWLDQPALFRRYLVLVLVRCQKPMILYSGIVVPLRMTSFLTFCKGAYSMLTLLSKMRKSSID
ncbi:hypothetical protein KR026_005357 [Drosophila bipectinata]|nr:hypothetical protein KR026_005357 [Drosophila bipectinata]